MRNCQMLFGWLTWIGSFVRRNEIGALHAGEGGQTGDALESKGDADARASDLERSRQSEEERVVLVALPVAGVVVRALRNFKVKRVL